MSFFDNISLINKNPLDVTSVVSINFWEKRKKVTVNKTFTFNTFVNGSDPFSKRLGAFKRRIYFQYIPLFILIPENLLKSENSVS